MTAPTTPDSRELAARAQSGDLLAQGRLEERRRIAKDLRLKAIEYRTRAEDELDGSRPDLAHIRGLRDMATNLEKQARRIELGQPLCRKECTP